MTENAPPPASTRRGLNRQEVLTIVVALSAGIGFIVAYALMWFASPQLSERWGWLAGVLLNLGTAALLVVPIEWFSSRLRLRVADVDERQTAATEELATQVETLDAQVEDLVELQERLSARQAARREYDESLFEGVGTALPTSSTVLEALNRASERKLISGSGVRVPIAKAARLRLRFAAPEPHLLTVTLERATGETYREFFWQKDQPTLDFIEQVGDAIDGAQEPLDLDAKYVFERLSATLTVAAKYQDPRPIIEYFPDQWALTEDAIVTTDGRGYSVTHDRTDRLMMDSHVRRKTWLDEDSYEEAFAVASYLFPFTSTQEKAEVNRRQTQSWG